MMTDALIQTNPTVHPPLLPHFQESVALFGVRHLFFFLNFYFFSIWSYGFSFQFKIPKSSDCVTCHSNFFGSRTSCSVRIQEKFEFLFFKKKWKKKMKIKNVKKTKNVPKTRQKWCWYLKNFEMEKWRISFLIKILWVSNWSWSSPETRWLHRSKSPS